MVEFQALKAQERREAGWVTAEAFCAWGSPAAAMWLDLKFTGRDGLQQRPPVLGGALL